MNKWNKSAVTLLCAMLALASCATAKAAPLGEYEVKAAFIHNIAKYVEWPAASHTSGKLALCVLGQNPFGDALDALQDKPIGGLNWEIVPASPGMKLERCHVLFIAASERDALERILQSIGNRPVLTIGDSEGYAEQGVMVNFYLEQNKVRFEINRGAAAQASLVISSQLLKLARVITGNGGAP